MEQMLELLKYSKYSYNIIKMRVLLFCINNITITKKIFDDDYHDVIATNTYF